MFRAETFGAWLKHQRQSRDWTQFELGQHVGCSTVLIRKFEADERRPSKQIALILAALFDIPVREHEQFVAFARGSKTNATPSVSDRLVDTTSFIGRLHELNQLQQKLSSPQCRLLVLTGPGGMGKTRLALQLSRQVFDQFPDGVFFTSLLGIDSAESLVSSIALVLSQQFNRLSDSNAQLLHYLQSRNLLLILDNYEHLLPKTELITEILAAAPRVKIIVTSRERLNLREEWTFPVSGLSYPETISDVGVYSAIELFKERAVQADLRFSLTPGDREFVARICSLVQGNPLAIELAAVWVRTMTCADIVRELERSLDILSTSARNAPEKHQSMRTTFESSWNLLDEDLRTTLRKLALFRGGFTREAAKAVALVTLSQLVALVDKALVQLDTSTGRYSLHELLRQYLLEKLYEAGERAAVAQRHYHYFLALAQGSEAHAFGGEQITYFDVLETELDNLRGTLTDSIASEDGLQLAATLGWFFSERAHWREGFDWLERALSANKDAPVTLRAKALHSAGALAGRFDTQQAQSYFSEALLLARAANDPWNTAWALSHMAIFRLMIPEVSRPLLEESLKLFRELDDHMGIAHTLVRLSWCALDAADYPYARELAEEALMRANQARDQAITAWALLTLGEVCWSHDHNLYQARTCFERSRSLFRAIHMYSIHSNRALADVERTLGNWTRADFLYREVLETGAKSGTDHPGHAYCLAGLAAVALELRQIERAVILLGHVERIITLVPESDTHGNVTFYRDVSTAQSLLDQSTFAALWETGKAMPRAQCIRFALDEPPYRYTKNNQLVRDDL